MDPWAQNGPLWDFSLKQLNASFLSADIPAGIGDLKPVLYMGRHSGASLDLQGRHRDHLELKKRGGWQCESSLRRYENAARLNLSASKLQPAQVAAFKRADELLEALFFGRVPAVAMPPARSTGA